jgi:hypothetical protein
VQLSTRGLHATGIRDEPTSAGKAHHSIDRSSGTARLLRTYYCKASATARVVFGALEQHVGTRL